MSLMFLPGSGCDSNVWRHQVEYFENSIGLNFPGHPDGDLIDSVVGLTDWLGDILNEYEDRSVVLVGHSFGGAVALQTAVKGHPALKGLVLIGTGSRLKVMPMILDSLAQLVETESDVPDMMFSGNKNIQEPLKTDINNGIQLNGVRALLNDFKACNEFDISDDLNTIKIPTQIIVGEKDVMTPLKYSNFLHSNIPNSQLSVVPDGSHMVYAEQPDQVNTTIEVFLKRL